MKGLLVALGALVLVAVIGVVGYLGGWWLTEDSMNRTTRVQDRSLAVQETARETVREVAADVRDLDVKIADPANAAIVVQLKAQRTAVVARGCTEAGRLMSPVASDIADFAATECGITLGVN